MEFSFKRRASLFHEDRPMELRFYMPVFKVLIVTTRLRGFVRFKNSVWHFIHRPQDHYVCFSTREGFSVQTFRKFGNTVFYKRKERILWR